MRHAALFFILAIAACGDVTNHSDASPLADGNATIDGAGAIDSGAADATAFDAEGSSCGPTERCVPPAPPTWSGPAMQMAAAGSTPAPDCPSALSSLLVTGHVGLDVGDTICSCTCTPQGASCSTTLSVDYSDNECTSALGGGQLTTSCSSLGGGSTAYRISTPAVNSGTCQKSESPTIPEIQRVNARALCQPVNTPAECGEGICLSQPGSDTYCISKNGDLDCPAGTDYQDRQVIFTGVTDTRSCSSCTCGGPTGTCGAQAELFNSACDATPDRTVAADGTCRVETSYDNGRLIIVSVSASCSTTPGTPQGEASATGLVTMCCLTF